MKCKKISILIFFVYGISLIEKSLCAIHCVRLAGVPLETLYMNSMNRVVEAGTQGWFPESDEEYDATPDLELICNEVVAIVFGEQHDGLRITGVTVGYTKIDNETNTPRKNLECDYVGGQIRIFPVPKYNTVFVAMGAPVNGFSTLGYCLQLKPYYSSGVGVVRLTNGIPRDYESDRKNSIERNLPNPFNSLTVQERYALCRQVFQAHYFSQIGIDVPIIDGNGTPFINYSGPIITYVDTTVFDAMTGEFRAYIYFENPKKRGKLPEKRFGPDKIIWCNSNLGTRYYIIFAYKDQSVYLLDWTLTPSLPNGHQFTLFRFLTLIDGIAAMDKRADEAAF